MGNEGALEPPQGTVHDDTHGDQHASGVQVHASESVHDGSTAEQQHGSDNDVGHDAEDEEDLVGGAAPTSADDFQQGMSVGGFALDLNSQDTEEDNLDGGTGGVPEGSGDAILPGDVGRLEHGGGPCPLGANNVGDQTGLDGTTGGVELFGGLLGFSEAVLEPNQEGGEEREDLQCDDGSGGRRETNSMLAHMTVVNNKS